MFHTLAHWNAADEAVVSPVGAEVVIRVSGKERRPMVPETVLAEWQGFCHGLVPPNDSIRALWAVSFPVADRVW